MPRLNPRLSLALCLALAITICSAVCARPALAGENTLISGFDRWVLGTPLPPEGDEFYTVFGGPLNETLDGLELVEYETTYELTMPSGVRNAKVTVGYNPDGLLEVIIVDMGVLDEPLDPALAGAYSSEIIQVLEEEYSPALLMVDAFPGGPDRSAEADPNSGTYVLADELRNTIWLTWSGSTVQTMYCAETLSTMMVEQTFGPLDDEGEIVEE